MGEWDSFLQSIFIGLIFSYLLAKLISVVISFKEDNLSITRNLNRSEDYQLPPKSDIQDEAGCEGYGAAHEMDSVGAEQSSVKNESVSGSDHSTDEDDWEGVESTELDEIFSAATAFIAAAAADRLSTQKVSNDVQLQLYSLYKIATEGPCTTPQPSALKMTARAKWQAWQKLGAMPPEEAMQQYIDIVTELYPSWIAGASVKIKRGDGEATNTDYRGPMGPVFSSFVYEEESGNDLKMDAIHAFSREGEVENLLKCIESGVPVNMKDSEGRTPLHWAVDRGHFNVTELLLSKNADVNAKDNEGQTPLHYAAMCDRKDIAEYLVQQNADTNIKDSDGSTPSDLSESKWTWMQLGKARQGIRLAEGLL